MNEIQNNPFRYLGIFANATLKERVAMEAQIKAYARVGQKVDNPLQLKHLLKALPKDEDSVREAESRLALADERAHFAAFWFVHGANPEEDLEAVRLLDQKKTSTALAIWSQRDDPEALQNLMVANLILGKWKQAVEVAHRLYHNENDIRRFATVVTTGTSLKMRQLVMFSADNSRWDAVLKDLRTDLCRKHIEQCLDDVDRNCNQDSLDALCDAIVDLDVLWSVYGKDDVVCQTLSERMSNALSQRDIMNFSDKQILKYLHKAYDLAITEQTKSRIVQWIVKVYMKNETRSRDIRKDIPGANRFVKNERFVIGFGIIGILIAFAAVGRTCSSINHTYQPPKMNLPEYHPVEIPNIPHYDYVPPLINIPGMNMPNVTTPDLPEFSEEELQEMHELNKKSEHPLTDEEWERVSKEFKKKTSDKNQE